VRHGPGLAGGELSSGFGDPQLPADAPRRVVVDLAVARHRRPAPVRRVHPHRVPAALAQRPAPVLPQVAEQLLALHGTTTPAGSWDTSELAIRCRKIGSSRSISGSLTAGSGLGSASPRPSRVSATSTNARPSIRRASSRSDPQLMAAGKSSTCACTPPLTNL